MVLPTQTIRAAPLRPSLRDLVLRDSLRCPDLHIDDKFIHAFVQRLPMSSELFICLRVEVSRWPVRSLSQEIHPCSHEYPELFFRRRHPEGFQSHVMVYGRRRRRMKVVFFMAVFFDFHMRKAAHAGTSNKLRLMPFLCNTGV